MRTTIGENMAQATPFMALDTTAEHSATLSDALFQVLDYAQARPMLDQFQGSATLGISSTTGWNDAFHDAGATIIVLVIMRSGRPVFVLPLEIACHSGMVVARHTGGSHANANFPAILAETGQSLAGFDVIAEITKALKQSPWAVDAVLLERQLDELDGIRNPLVTPASAISPNVALSFSTDMAFDQVMERVNGRRKSKKNRAQARKFETAGGYELKRLTDPQEARAAFDAFLEMKAAQFKDYGISDPFARPGVTEAMRAIFSACNSDQRHGCVLDVLEVGGEVRAISGSSLDKGVLTVHFAGFRNDELASTSPGDFLTYWMISQCCAGDTKIFDLGVGDEPYKRSWCDTETWHRDTEIALSAKGKAILIALAAKRSLVRRIKANDRLWAAIKQIKRKL